MVLTFAHVASALLTRLRDNVAAQAARESGG